MPLARQIWHAMPKVLAGRGSGSGWQECVRICPPAQFGMANIFVRKGWCDEARLFRGIPGGEPAAEAASRIGSGFGQCENSPKGGLFAFRFNAVFSQLLAH